MSTIYLHSFESSPFGEKVRLILGLKGVEWKSVDPEMVMPKPNLTALTGGYRKTPVMQIGADIYCDSRLIADELERRYPAPTLFPGGSRGLCLALSEWADTALHIASSGLAIGVNKRDFPEALMADRKKFFKGFMDIENIETQVPHLRSQLRAHAGLIEDQLSDGRQFWLGGEPSFADFHVHVEIWTIRAFVPFAGDLLSGMDSMATWEKRVKAIGHGHKTRAAIGEAHEAARLGTTLPGRGVEDNNALGLCEGDWITVTPDDYGKEPVAGRLVTLSLSEVAVEREDPIVGNVTVHFPRIGYRITKN
ncbi:glutathione s-transferase [Fusarium albosuccineum]|uniref:Glutathione s-transferase n=1 Tax=Fusarium albosuccineum TaxID=1237068 RepID=A0A8H4KX80_9HYPO|nr:glutathione s-transferase [Fusarium albosuccineum]